MFRLGTNGHTKYTNLIEVEDLLLAPVASGSTGLSVHGEIGEDGNTEKEWSELEIRLHVKPYADLNTSRRDQECSYKHV